MEQSKNTCTVCNKEFLIIEREQAFYTKKNLPKPTVCFACRRERRSALRNKRALYERTCAKCGTALLSTYEQNSPYIIYCESCYVESVN